MLVPLLYPDAQAVLIGYLAPLVAPVPVHGRIPTTRPATFVQVRRVGGTADGVLDRARLDLWAWADTDERAHDLCMTLRRHVAAMPGSNRVAAVAEFAGPLPAPDESNQPRWLVSYEVALRGTP